MKKNQPTPPSLRECEPDMFGLRRALRVMGERKKGRRGVGKRGTVILSLMGGDRTLIPSQKQFARLIRRHGPK